MIGIIGGTGFYDPDFLTDPETLMVETPFGDAEITLGRWNKKRIAFIPRHGLNHSIPPHRIGYRKNIWALKTAGADRVISINSVGSLDDSIPPASVLIPHDFIDFTKGRDSTFFDKKVVHIDLSKPYCGEIRDALCKGAGKYYDKVFSSGVYVCTQGPRFETPSEIKMLRMLGGDVVGMVGYPEVSLSREAGLCYASICTVTNYGCGISESSLTVEEVESIARKNLGSMKETIKFAFKTMPGKKTCECPSNTSEAEA